MEQHSDSTESSKGGRTALFALLGVAGAAVIAFLAFGVFGIHTAFIDDEVNEDLPFDGFGEAAPADTDTDPDIDDNAGSGDTPAPTDAVAIDDGSADDESSPSTEAPTTDEEPAVDEGTPDDEPEAEAPATPTIETLAAGEFLSLDHPTTGAASIITDGDRTFLRFEDLQSDNGPDLNVYLSTAPADGSGGAFDDEFIDLGDLKGNVGDQNYEIDSDVDISAYQSVVIWCVRFGVGFGVSPLV